MKENQAPVGPDTASAEELRRGLLDDCAKTISNLFMPPVVNVALACAVLGRASSSLRAALGWVTLYVVVTVILPMDFLALWMHQQEVSNIDVKKRHERMPKLLIGIAVSLVALGLFRVLGAPELFQFLLAVGLILHIIMTAITVFWRISFRGASIAAVGVVLSALYGPVGYLAFLLVPLVWWSQVHSGRHTWPQVAAGVLIGGPLYWLALEWWFSTGCF